MLAQELAELETYCAMAEGVNSGLDFTQALDNFNSSDGGKTRQRVDVLADGSLGPRVHPDAATVRYWVAAGGRSHMRGGDAP